MSTDTITQAEAAIFARIAELDRECEAPALFSELPTDDRHRATLLRMVRATLDPADNELFGAHLAVAVPGPVTDALQRSRWLRSTLACCWADLQIDRRAKPWPTPELEVLHD